MGEFGQGAISGAGGLGGTMATGGSGAQPTGGGAASGGAGGAGGGCVIDTDGDGVCDPHDICPGFQDHGDGTCSAFFTAATSETLSRQMWVYDADTGSDDCPLTQATASVGGHPDNSGIQWSLHVRYSLVGGFDRFNQMNAYLSFDTSSLPDAVTILDAALVIRHAGTTTTALAQLWGGTQPLFGGTVDATDFFAGTALLDEELMSTIVQQGLADFIVATDQVNTAGWTQLKVALTALCPWSDGHGIGWDIHSPHAAATQRPELGVVYQP